MNDRLRLDRYSDRPCHGELVAIVLAGLVHVLVEVGFSERVARAYNASVSIAFLVYVVWRVRRTPGVLRAWGMRRDNLWSSARAQLGFGSLAIYIVLEEDPGREILGYLMGHCR